MSRGFKDVVLRDVGLRTRKGFVQELPHAAPLTLRATSLRTTSLNTRFLERPVSPRPARARVHGSLDSLRRPAKRHRRFGSGRPFKAERSPRRREPTPESTRHGPALSRVFKDVVLRDVALRIKGAACGNS